MLVMSHNGRFGSPSSNDVILIISVIPLLPLLGLSWRPSVAVSASSPQHVFVSHLVDLSSWSAGSSSIYGLLRSESPIRHERRDKILIKDNQSPPSCGEELLLCRDKNLNINKYTHTQRQTHSTFKWFWSQTVQTLTHIKQTNILRQFSPIHTFLRNLVWYYMYPWYEMYPTTTTSSLSKLPSVNIAIANFGADYQPFLD